MRDPARRALADELYAAGRDYDALQPDRLARWRNVEPETAALLGVPALVGEGLRWRDLRDTSAARRAAHAATDARSAHARGGSDLPTVNTAPPAS